MSAIFGILRFDAAGVSAGDLERMSLALAHRGPDGRKVIAHKTIGLGHCLMRVNKEDVFEAQPLRNRDADLTLVADARIDNREELADAFGVDAATLKVMPDSALIMRAYATWGEDCADRLVGDFAFAMWDGRARKLVLGRDHMGQRSFVYHCAENFFAFASEANALWAVPGVPRALSDAAIGRHLFLAPSTTRNATLFEGINFPLGGSLLTVAADGTTTERRYWTPHADPNFLGRTEETYVARYRDVLTEAVECRIRRLIGPPALCLSGGYDSAAIAGVSGPVLAEQGRKLIAVSSVMPEGYDGPLSQARHWVELCRRDMPHLAVRYIVRDDAADVTNLQRAFLNTHSIPGETHPLTELLFRQAAAAGARLIMDGIGGDETLNPRASGILVHLLRSGQFRRFLAELIARKRLLSRSYCRVLRDDVARKLAPLWLRRGWRRLRHGASETWADYAIAPDFAATLVRSGAVDPSNMLLGLHRYAQKYDAVQRLLRAAAKPSLNHADQAALCGLDLTRPMLDKRVVEFGLAIPEDLYVKKGQQRYLACRALAGVYPPEFQSRLPRYDPLDPIYAGLLAAAVPRLKVEVERLAANAHLRKYVDFEKLKSAVNGYSSMSGYAPRMGRAMRAFHTAKYIAWFRGDNA